MAKFGAVRLRAFQVAKELQQYLSVEVLPLSECFSRDSSLIILVKPRRYEKIPKLFKKGNVVVVDLLDTVNLLERPATLFQRVTNTSPVKILKQVDAAIFCSDKTRHSYSHFFKHPELCQTVYHHWDNRFQRRLKPEFNALNIGYFGLPRKAHLVDHLEGVDFHDMRSYEKMDSRIFDQYNAHYIVKPDESHYQFEPLTKIATAAFAQSPVIARKGHEEELLGADYPYYIDSMSKLDIVETMDKMQQTYQDDIWQQALDIMESIYHKTSLSQVSQQYLKIIKQLSG